MAIVGQLLWSVIAVSYWLLRTLGDPFRSYGKQTETSYLHPIPCNSYSICFLAKQT